MTKNEQIRFLLEEYRKVLLNEETDNGICFDGIVDEATFAQQACKIAVLLKETNGTDSTGDPNVSKKDWPYLQWIRDQQADAIPQTFLDQNQQERTIQDAFYSPTFRKLCLWLAIFHDLAATGDCNIAQFFKNGKVDVASVRKSLYCAAIVNLKKTWGKDTTDYQKLAAYVLRDEMCDVLVRQMNIIAPDIVLCGSADVYALIKSIAEQYGTITEKQTTSAIITSRKNQLFSFGKTVFINFYHPACRGRTDLVYAKYAKEVFAWAIEYYKTLQA